MAKRISELDNTGSIEADDLLEIAVVDAEAPSGFSSRSIRYGDLTENITSGLITYRRPISINDIFNETGYIRMSYMVANLTPEIDVSAGEAPNSRVEIHKAIFKISFVATMSDNSYRFCDVSILDDIIVSHVIGDSDFIIPTSLDNSTPTWDWFSFIFEPILDEGSTPLEISEINGYFDFCGSVRWFSNV